MSYSLKANENNGGLPTRRDALRAGLFGAVALAPSAGSTSVGSASALFAVGVHRIDRDLTIDESLVLSSGTRLLIAASVTLTLRGDLIAPAEHIFDGPGRIDLTLSRVLFARPEWWGAKADDATIDNAAPFDACLAAHPAMQLGLGDYHLPNGWSINRSNRRVWGIGRTKDARGTRLLRHGPQGAVLTLGQQSPPPLINDYARGLDLRWLELGRTQAPAALGANEAQWPIGLMVRHVLDARCEGLRADEHAIGYSIRGAVRSFFEDCAAFRSTGGSDSAGEQFIGFDLDGRSPLIATGANASLYLVDCGVNLGGAPRLTTSIGCRLLGALSDSFIIRLETTSLDVGIEVDGQAARLTPAQRRNAHLDFTIEMPVLDQCRRAGVRMTGLSAEAMVTIRSPYVGLSGGATAAIEISDSGGSIAIDHGQLVGTFAPGAQGVKLDRVSGFSCSGTAIQGFARPIVASATTSFDLVVAINPGALRETGAAIALVDCHAGYIRPRILGDGAYRAAVELDTRSGRITVEAGAIDLRSTDGQLVVRDGMPIPFPADRSNVTI